MHKRLYSKKNQYLESSHQTNSAYFLDSLEEVMRNDKMKTARDQYLFRFRIIMDGNNSFHRPWRLNTQLPVNRHECACSFFFLEGREGVFRARFGKFSFFSFLFFPFNLPHVQDELQDVAMEEPYVEFASYCNSLTTFLWWEGSVYAILSFLLPPAARLWLQWRRLIRSKKLELFVSVEYRHTFLVRMPTWLEMAGVKCIYIYISRDDRLYL